ncbi:MAG: purine-nucleoside phosphorylase [Clostridia bacterium]|nr:purine-nucleoside phosphorylase [Clostridia bacterium]
MTPHIESKKEDIAKIVIMPGDPLRAKYIVENYLDDYKLINSVRNVLGYTGFYKGKRITVMASGMGMPSMGVYAFELYKFYDVETIIRVGSCGAYSGDIKLLENILVKKSFTEGNFAKNMTGIEEHISCADSELNKLLLDKARENDIEIRTENIACTECFDPYIEDINSLLKRFPKEENIVGAEMEAFSLFYTAKVLKRKAACLLTVVDSVINKEFISSESREKSLNDTIKIALEACLEI